MIKIKPKFEIGQEVSDGFICAIYMARFYVLTSPTSNYDNWTKEDPQWLDKFVYCLKLNEPTKGITFEQFQNQYSDLDYIILEEKFNSLPLYWHTTIPEAVINV